MNEEERQTVLSGDNKAIQALHICRESCDKMNDTLVDNTNERVSEKDRLWLLGDFVWTGQATKHQQVQTWQYYRGKLRCKNVFFVWGNHDPKVHSPARQEISKLFSGTYDLVNTRIEDKRVALSHYAMAIWDGRHHGSWHLYGHSHSNAETWLDQIMPGRFSMDVGIDNANVLLGEYRPFTWPEICAIMAKRSGFGLLGSRDYHHADA